MNKLIDRTLSSLFRLAERLTGGAAVLPTDSSSSASSSSVSSTPPAPEAPQKIRFTQADKWVQLELFD